MYISNRIESCILTSFVYVRLDSLGNICQRSSFQLKSTKISLLCLFLHLESSNLLPTISLVQDGEFFSSNFYYFCRPIRFGLAP
ncbi:hypothetical protein BLOT_014810 [Blomia tropicalis]|nr:hypothetical protein BLOT_014810 [Blomia tropicalis]